MGPTASGDRHAAALWKPADRGAVDCFLCEHRCHIAPGGGASAASARTTAGALVTLVYGRLIARHVDPIEKKPLFHFLPGSQSYSVAAVGCNFQCGFCQNWQISQYPRGSAGEMPGEGASPEDVVAAARAGPLRVDLVYVYRTDDLLWSTRPTRRALAAREGLRNVFVTNGFHDARGRGRDGRVARRRQRGPESRGATTSTAGCARAALEPVKDLHPPACARRACTWRSRRSW